MLREEADGDRPGGLCCPSVLGGTEVIGISFPRGPNSSARSVIARFDVPSINWMDRVMYAVATIITTKPIATDVSLSAMIKFKRQTHQKRR